MINSGKIIIISGPSGVGKSTVLAYVLKELNDPYFSVSATTREPRPGEVDGREYYFISKETFESMIAEDKFLEYARYVDNYYGTPSEPVISASRAGRDVFLDVEVQGKMQVSEKLPEAISIFIAPPSIEDLSIRLHGRGTESEEKIAGRIKRAAEEMELSGTYDYVVVNDIPERAAKEILDIIKK